VDWIHLAQDRNNKQAVLGALAKLRKATTRFVTSMSVRLSAWISAPSGRISMKFDI
jgi:hypothetical protein